MNIDERHNLRHSLTGLGGVFYPRDHVLCAFTEPGAALAARQDLLAGGYDEMEVEALTPERFAREAEDIVEQSNSFLAGVGAENKVTLAYEQHAEDGHGLLIAYAPSAAETDRAMRVFRRHGVLDAHKYHRFAIEALV